jgi:GT2 family glycosyltransferase
MDISIIIVTWNSEEFIRKCLHSCLRNSEGLSREIIVVDNSSMDGTAQIIREFHSQVNLIENKTNEGYSKANNQGIEKSTGRYMLLLNPDTEIQGNALDLMLKFMEANPKIGALGPKLINPDGTVQPSCREFPTYSTLIWEFTGLSRILPKSRVFGSWRMGYFDFNQPGEVDQPMGSCLMLRRETFNQVGLFDENFTMFFNDVDLCYRIKKVGWKIFFFPDAQVVHQKGASTGKAKRKMIWLSHLAFYKFFRKYKTGWLNRLLLLLFSIPLFVSALPRMILKK